MNKDSEIVTQTVEHLSTVRSQVNKYGNTPVYYVPKKEWLKPQRPPSLSHFILNASTEAEVNKLLTKGKTEFKDAQPKTIRMWEKQAAKRIAELKAKQ